MCVFLGQCRDGFLEFFFAATTSDRLKLGHRIAEDVHFTRTLAMRTRIKRLVRSSRTYGYRKRKRSAAATVTKTLVRTKLAVVTTIRTTRACVCVYSQYTVTVRDFRSLLSVARHRVFSRTTNTRIHKVYLCERRTETASGEQRSRANSRYVPSRAYIYNLCARRRMKNPRILIYIYIFILNFFLAVSEIDLFDTSNRAFQTPTEYNAITRTRRPTCRA